VGGKGGSRKAERGGEEVQKDYFLG
jgi:hypothetical protein